MIRTRLRCVLLGLVVTSSASSASAAIINVPGDFATIQDAFNAAASGDEIVVAPGTYAGLLMFVPKAIIIRSSGGAAVTTLMGDGALSVVNRVLQSVGTTIDGFTLTNGGPSGAITIGGSSATNIVIANCIIENNTNHGARIGLVTGGPLTVTNTIFRNNPGIGLIVGTSNLNPASVSDSTFFNNTGGGIETSVTTAVTDCVFQDNVAFGLGGAIVLSSNKTLTVTRCQFINNAAPIDGGAIHVGELNSSVSVVDSSFTGNMADGNGGAMFVNGPNSSVTNCSFTSNTAGVNGGAILVDALNSSVTSSSFTSNMAGVDGGAIHTGSTLGIVNSTFDTNSAIAGSGGGLFTTGTTSVTGCILIGNSAAVTGGGIRTEIGASAPLAQTTYCLNTPNDLDLAGSTLTRCTVTGACCLPQSGCISLTAASCLSAGGAYQGDGVLCIDAACPGPCAGDADSSGVVDFNDITSVLSNWLSICP